MNNVHEDHPVVFESRWVMSYLRGPLLREEIRRLGVGRIGEAGHSPPPLPHHLRELGRSIQNSAAG